MPFNVTDMRVPNSLRTESFVLRPIRAADARLDHEAVMESRQYLRLWEQSGWPAEDFTIEENRKDLIKLEQRHSNQESFAYTVMNLTETQCLGCVYVFPIDANIFVRSSISSCDGFEWSDNSAAVYFWIRKSKLAEALDRQLLGVLCSWLKSAWNFRNCVFVTSEEFSQQVKMIEEAGLFRKFRIIDPKVPGMFVAYSGEIERQ